MMSKSLPSIKKKEKQKISHKQMLIKEREAQWYSRTLITDHGIPEYSSDKDPNCPRAVVRVYNKTKKLNANVRAEKGKGATAWIENTMRKKFDDIPIRREPSLREKANSIALESESVAEVEILQKIIVRENFITELKKLVKYQFDIDSIISEVAELVKVIRNQTVEIIEDIYEWKNSHSTMSQFLYRGENYLMKISTDMAFLDDFEDIGNYFGFYFSGNPVMFLGRAINDTSNSILSDKYDYMSDDKKVYEGILEKRLKMAENIVYNEISLFDSSSTINNEFNSSSVMDGKGVMEQSSLHIGEEIMNQASIELTRNRHNIDSKMIEQSVSITGPSNFNNSHVNSSSKRDVTTKKVSSKRAYIRGTKEKIAMIMNEIDEIYAMRAHVEDKIQTLGLEVENMEKKIHHLENRKKEYIFLQRHAHVQHIEIEMSLLAADIADKNVKIKNLSRESYFLRQEISRKRGIARVMQQDMDSELKNAHMKNKLMKKAKKQGLMVALLDLEKDMDSMIASKREINGIGESDTVSDMEDKSYKISTTEKNMNHSVTEEFDDETIATNAVSNLDKDPHIGFPNENSICSESLDELMYDEEVAVLISPERLVNEVQALASSISHFGISATLEMCVNVTIVASEARTKKAVALACTQSAIGIVLDNLVEKIAAENYSRDKKTVAKAYAQNSVLFVVDSLVSKESLHRHEIEVLKQKQLDDIKNARYVKAREVAESVISLSLDEMLIRIVEDKECEYNAIREVAKKEAHDAIMEALDTLIREHSAVDEDSSWQVIARACAESAITTTLENLVSNLSPIKLLSMAYAENAVATVFNMLHIEKEYRSHPRPKSPEKLMSCSIVSSALNYSLTNLGFVAEERPRSPERTAANSFVATAIVSSLSKLSFIALSHDTANKSTTSQFSADRRKFDSAVDEDNFFICEGAEDCDKNNSANFQNNHHPSIVTENISTVDILDIDKFHNSESNSQVFDSAEYSYINNTTSKPDTAFDSSVVFLNGSTSSPQYESENDQYGTSTNVEEGVSSDIFPAGGGCAAVKAKRKTSVGNGDLNNAKPDAAYDSSVFYPVFANGCTSFVRTYLTPELFDSMREKYTSNNIGIYDIINIGLKDSHDPIGLRALDGESYDVFRDIFDPIIRSCQNITPETDIQHVSDCDSSSILRMEMIDYSYVNYFQLQCSRSVSGLLFTTPSNAKSIENPLSSVLTRLRGQFQGSYQSLSTLSHQELSKLDSETLCSSRVKVDGSLGGQGVYFTENREFVVWINTDNHFELMVQQKTDGRPSDISSLFEQWVASENALEVSLHKQEQKYSFSSTLGYLTNSPSNIGTAFHIYFVVKLSQLGKDESALMQTCANLSLRCERFEGDWKISNVITLGKTEIEIVQYVIDALIYLIDCEKNN